MRRSRILKIGRLRHDERAARTALELAGSKEGSTNVWVDDWKLESDKDSYRTRIQARDFSLDLEFLASKIVLQGQNGFSRKGINENEASYYYSRPQLKVTGTANGNRVTGLAWLDHEWSSQYMAADASGWDWCGLNMNDGSALMAFRMRGKNGGNCFFSSKRFISGAADMEVAAYGRYLSGSHDGQQGICALSRSWTTRSSMRAPAPARSTGKAR
jgi:predicted secreted hydrolase